MKGCKFYGFCSFPDLKVMVTQGGNQCALISEAYSPCRMEVRGLAVEFEACELRGSARALEYDKFERMANGARP